MEIEIYFLEIGDILLHSQDMGYATALEAMGAEELVSEPQSEDFQLGDRMEQLKGAVQSKEAKIVNKFHKTRNDLQAGGGIEQKQMRRLRDFVSRSCS